MKLLIGLLFTISLSVLQADPLEAVRPAAVVPSDEGATVALIVMNNGFTDASDFEIRVEKDGANQKLTVLRKQRDTGRMRSSPMLIKVNVANLDAKANHSFQNPRLNLTADQIYFAVYPLIRAWTESLPN